jgi:putative PIN family toxin of toxin-antitoxin system
VPRIVADTNIYISAYNFGGLPDQILVLARRKSIELFVCTPILVEIEGVLRNKFRWPSERIEYVLTEIQEITSRVESEERLTVVQKDESDDRILECAVSANAEVIVSGDRHLRELNSFRGIRILTARAFLDTIR